MNEGHILYLGYATRVADDNRAMGTEWAWCCLSDSHMGPHPYNTERRYCVCVVEDEHGDHELFWSQARQRPVYFGKKKSPRDHRTPVNYYPCGQVESISVRVEPLFHVRHEPSLAWLYEQARTNPLYFAYYDDLLTRNERYYPDRYREWQAFKLCQREGQVGH